MFSTQSCRFSMHIFVLKIIVRASSISRTKISALFGTRVLVVLYATFGIYFFVFRKLSATSCSAKSIFDCRIEAFYPAYWRRVLMKLLILWEISSIRRFDQIYNQWHPRSSLTLAQTIVSEGSSRRARLPFLRS